MPVVHGSSRAQVSAMHVSRVRRLKILRALLFVTNVLHVGASASWQAVIRFVVNK